MHVAVFDQPRDDHAGTMVPKTTGMDVSRLEVVPERVHRQQGRVAGFIAVVVFKLTAREFRTTLRLCCYKLRVFVGAVEDMTHEGKGNAAKVAAAPEACDDLIGIFTCHLHLLLCLQADDCLMERHVVEHGSEGVLAARCRGSQFDRLRDSCA